MQDLEPQEVIEPTFFSMLQRELEDTYLKEIRTHMTQLEFRQGVLISSECSILFYRPCAELFYRSSDRIGLLPRLLKLAGSFEAKGRNDYFPCAIPGREKDSFVPGVIRCMSVPSSARVRRG